MSVILGIESSCDETSASILVDGIIKSNVISTQLDHADWGGVIPEIASRLHMKKIVAVVKKALNEADIDKNDLDAIAFTCGPGLIGALIVGTCFAKGLALGLNVPIIEVNHLQAHVVSNLINEPRPEFPFICLTVSGGHTQLVLVKTPLDMEIIGETIDDAAGEAFDKAGKIMGLSYPAGKFIDQYAQEGDPGKYSFPLPKVGELNFSFSGLKTSLLYFLRDRMKEDPQFIKENIKDICASYQAILVKYLLSKLKKAAIAHNIKHLTLAGGVSANSELRRRFEELCKNHGWHHYLPELEYTTDNAAMIALAGSIKLKNGQLASHTAIPYARAGKH